MGRTPVRVTVEAPSPWLMRKAGSGLQVLSAGGLTVDGREHTESTPQSPATWTGSPRLCRRIKLAVINYNKM